MTPVSPFGAQADAHAVDWAKENRLVETAAATRLLATTRPGTLAAHCYPTADAADLCLLGDWMSWLFVLDDMNDEGAYGRQPDLLEHELTRVILSVGSASPIADTPLANGLADIVGRLGDRMPEQWRHRFLRHIVDYFIANVWQAAHRCAGDIPDISAFPRMRRDAGAIMPSFDLIEFVESAALPANVYYSRAYQCLLTTAANVVCWTNDLMTLEKELAQGDTQNLVCVVGEAAAVPLAEAVEEVIERTDREIELFLATETELERLFAALRVSDDVETSARNCVAMLRSWMRGHVDWGLTTVRYALSNQEGGAS